MSLVTSPKQPSSSDTPSTAAGVPRETHTTANTTTITPLGSPIELAHPTPDLQSLQGAYVQNVERLEERAERMSVSSDLGEEIRKLQLEQKASDSRRASLLMMHAAGNTSAGSESATGNGNAVEHHTLSHTLSQVHARARNLSTSPYANSIVEVNSAARFGGYSPYSPMGSVRSGSWSQVSHPMSNPARSVSRRSSKFGMISTPEIGEAFCESPKEIKAAADDNSSIQHTPRPQSKTGSSAVGDDDDDPRVRRMNRLSTGRLPSDGSFSELYNQLAEANRRSMDIMGTRVVSDTSFTDIYDQIAGEIKDSLDTSVMGAQERELKRQSLASTPQLLAPFTEPAEAESSKPMRLSQTPPPLPPQHKQLPQQEEAQEDYGINFSFTASVEQDLDDRPEGGRLQIHVPRDSYSDNEDDRPLTANSQDTFQQAEGLFQDFDGTHYAPSMLSRYSSLRETSHGPGTAAAGFPVDDPNRSSLLAPLPETSVASLVPPPPEEGMVYYPAPVPRMLNLPQRISQAPSVAAMTKRKTQVINALPDEARRSAYWLPQAPGSAPPAEPGARASRMNLSALPPQLRASIFFDPGAQQRDVEIKEQSAVRTLDDLLDASALAPVSAFTDHPIVGKTNVYKKSSDVRGSTLDLRPPPTLQKKERKSSFLGLRRSSVSSQNALDDRRSVSPNRLVRSHSAVALDDSALARGPDGALRGEGHSGRSSPALDPNGVYGDLRDHDASDEDGGVILPPEDAVTDEDSDAELGAPTTLLAELELRKREQKNRNRTAYTAFPDGMHATLLELDDVAQLQKVKRKKQRVALAWEDPALKVADEMAEVDDEDVPLGVIYANNKTVQQRIKEQDLAEGRPLGLIEKKELEDNEPLSRRMLRLRGINPNSVMRQGPPVAITNPEGEQESESEHEGETLGQRLKRLRDKKALDEAISEVEARPISEAFSVDMLSQLGVEPKEKPKDTKQKDGLHSRNVSTGGLSTVSAPKSPGGGVLPPSRSNATTPGTPGTPGEGEEEETLGQRRARLQREATQAAMQRRQSSLTLPTNARLSTMNLLDSNNNTTQNGAPAPARTPPPKNALRASVSMADLLAANPAGQYDARKVSNEMLLATAPQSSLLAREAEQSAARKARMRLSSAELLQPHQQQRPDLLRQTSGMTGMSGGSGGLYGMMMMNGASGGGGVPAAGLGVSPGGMYVNQAQMYGMWAAQQGAQMPMQANGAAMMHLHQQGYGYPLTPSQYPSPAGAGAQQYAYAGGMGSMGLMGQQQMSPYGAMSVNPVVVYARPCNRKTPSVYA